MNHMQEIILKMKANAKLYGNKAAADLAFTELGVGLNASVFGSEESLETIKKKLLQRYDFQKKMVVRFSKNNKTNLPVSFNLNGIAEVLEFIKNKRKEDYATIVCPIFNILNSFELYYETETIYLCVLPGKWDITVNAPVDIIIIPDKDKKTIKIIMYEKERTVKGLSEKTVKPFTLFDLEKFAKYVISKRDILGALKEIYDPLFVRGWQDHNGNFCLTNCRESNYAFEFYEPKKILFRLSHERDIYCWDGKTDIFFDVCADSREKDDIIYQIAEKLIERGVKTVCCNSVLSHQAIILREVGLKTTQIIHNRNTVIKEMVD